MFSPAEVLIEVGFFGDVADATLEDFAGFGIFVDVVAIQCDFAGRRIEQTDDYLDGSALAGAVRTEIAERFAAMNHKADMVDNRNAGVTFRQVANFEHDNRVYYIVTSSGDGLILRVACPAGQREWRAGRETTLQETRL